MLLQIISIPPTKTKLYLPSKPLTLHHLHRNLSLIACLVDGAMVEELIINSWARKKQEAIQDILWSVKTVLSRSQFYFD